MFGKLQNRFSEIFKNIRGHGKITDDNISDAIREIRRALLESDVNYKVVSTFIGKVKEKASGSRVLNSITPGQQFVKIVLDELIDFLSSTELEQKININASSCTVIVMAGLQGSGKTTTSAKLASFLKRELSKQPLLVGADLQRPGAQDQLKVLSKKIDVDFYSEKNVSVINLVKNALQFANKNSNNVVIIDTAGRLHVDDDLIVELQEIINVSNPSEILFVIDGMSGHDAVYSSKIFSEICEISGSVLTKMDGDSGGGAALSVKEITGSPIKFMGVGENINDFEKFDSSRIARRILGLDDILGLVEEAQKTFDEKEALSLKDKIQNNKFDFNDFLNQMSQFEKMGSFSNMSKYIPGLNKIKNLDNQEQNIKWTKAIIQSMTGDERSNPTIINGSRRLRIARGSGRSVAEVNKLIKQFSQMKLMMKKISGNKMGKFPFKF